MLAYVVGDGFQRLRRGLTRVVNPGTWMDPFLERATTIVHDHNRMNLMMGRSYAGAPFAPVKRKHGGPPLLEGKGPPPYRAIELAVVVAEQTGRNTFEISISWPQFKSKNGRDVLSMHMKPYKNRPARPAVGIAVSAREEIGREWVRFTGRQLGHILSDSNVETGTEQFSGVIRGRR